MIQMPLKRGILWIVLSVFLVSGSATAILLAFRYFKGMYTSDDRYHIAAIVQATSGTETLQNLYFAELLDLSIDHPINLYSFSTKEAFRKLSASPLVKEASIKKIPPGTLYITYEMRKPIAFLANYINTVVDTDGYVFPFKPFFTPKNLPELFLSQEEVGDLHWGDRLQGRELRLAFSFLADLEADCECNATLIQRIDVSKAFASSCGQRQIVLGVEERVERAEAKQMLFWTRSCILRLNPEEYRQGLANYATLRHYLEEQEYILVKKEGKNKLSPLLVDLRLPQLAFY